MKESKSDNEIIKLIKEGVNLSENYQIISDRHSAIFYKMASKYISKKFREKRIDFFKDKDYYIFQVILDYDPDRNTKFSTYLANRIKWMCINSYNKTINCCEVNCPDQLMYNCKDENYSLDTSLVFEAMNLIKKDKDERVFKIFHSRYIEGKNNDVMPWAEVCKQSDINLSIQGCINIHNKYLNKIRKVK